MVSVESSSELCACSSRRIPHFYGPELLGEVQKGIDVYDGRRYLTHNLAQPRICQQRRRHHSDTGFSHRDHHCLDCLLTRKVQRHHASYVFTFKGTRQVTRRYSAAPDHQCGPGRVPSVRQSVIVLGPPSGGPCGGAATTMALA